MPFTNPRADFMDQGGSHLEFPTRLKLVSAKDAEPPRADHVRRIHLAILMLTTAAIGFAASPLVPSATMRVGLAIAAVIVAASAWLSTRKTANQTRPVALEPPALVVNSEGIRLDATRSNNPSPLISLSPGFGVTLLASADRTHFVVAISTGKGTLCVGADLSPAEKRRLAFVFPSAVTVTREELAMATQSTTGAALLVDATSLMRLIEILTQVDATALGRFVLTDNQGREIVLDEDRLLTPRCTIRLDQPFEWRALRFCEGVGPMDAEFQGTWIRQGKNEIVLVALLSGDVRLSIHDSPRPIGPSADAMLRRDLRLANNSRAAPPPLDQRIAVDRLFMLPLRRALDGAHCERRDSIPDGAELG